MKLLLREKNDLFKLYVRTAKIIIDAQAIDRTSFPRFRAITIILWNRLHGGQRYETEGSAPIIDSAML
jgi:hypothetical protein